jgi:hypothetical protein
MSSSSSSSSSIDDLLRNADALLQLRDALGDEVFAEQRDALLDEFLATKPSIVQAAAPLAALHQKKFIDSALVAKITKKLMEKAPSQTVTSVSASPVVPVVTTTTTTTTPKKKAFHQLGSISAALADALQLLSIETVSDLEALIRNHTAHRALDQLLAPELVREFEAASEPLAGDRVYVLASADNEASVMLLPLGATTHVYSELFTGDESEGDECVIFALDISASMNHDEKGTYLAPKSADHAASRSAFQTIHVTRSTRTSTRWSTAPA